MNIKFGKKKIKISPIHIILFLMVLCLLASMCKTQENWFLMPPQKYGSDDDSGGGYDDSGGGTDPSSGGSSPVDSSTDPSLSSSPVPTPAPGDSSGGSSTLAPVNCETSAWSVWDPPAIQCGKVIEQTRIRSITRQPEHNGTACPTLSETRDQPGPECASVNCQVSEWTNWGPPALQCGRHYQQTRTRSITRQPEHGGTACPELVERRGRYGFCM